MGRIFNFLCETTPFGEADLAVTIAHAQHLGIDVTATRIHKGWWSRIWKVQVAGTTADVRSLSVLLEELA